MAGRASGRAREPTRDPAHPWLDAGADEGRFEIDLDAHRLDRRLEQLDRDGIEVAIISFPPTMAWESARELAVAYHEGIERLVGESEGRLRASACGESRPGYAGACISGRRLIAGVEDRLGARGRRPGALRPPLSAGVRSGRRTALVDSRRRLHGADASCVRVVDRPGPDATRGVPVVFTILAGGAAFQHERLRGRGGPEPESLPELLPGHGFVWPSRARALSLDVWR